MTTAVIFDPEKTWDGSEDEALRLELEAANELNERLQRALERSNEEAIALRRTLEDEQRKRVEADTRARSCVHQGLAGVSDFDLMAEVERRAIAEIRGA